MVQKQKTGRKPEKQKPAPPGRPECPEWLDDRGKAVWEKTVAHLEAVPGLLSTIDDDSLATYADAWSDYFNALDEIRQQGQTAISDKGLPYQHPAVGMKNQAWKRIQSYFKAFGFTPEARRALKIEAKKTDTDPFERFLASRMENN